MLLEDKNAVIYGGGGAIGGAVARAFAGEGARVFLADRTLAKLDEVAGEIRSDGGVAETAVVDTLDERAVEEHADAVVGQIGDRTHLVLVAQSMGGLTAPLVCGRVPVDLLILLNAMVPPEPGETPGDWWSNTGHGRARREQAERDGRDLDSEDIRETFFHDVPPEVVEEAWARGEPSQSGAPFTKPWPLQEWPEVPTRFLQGHGDRFFPVEFQRRVVRERPGIVPDEMAGWHLLDLSRPKELADRLEAYREGVGGGDEER